MRGIELLCDLLADARAFPCSVTASTLGLTSHFLFISARVFNRMLSAKFLARRAGSGVRAMSTAVVRATFLQTLSDNAPCIRMFRGLYCLTIRGTNFAADAHVSLAFAVCDSHLRLVLRSPR